MARIAGIDIPKNKRGVISLTYIFGIGRSRSKEILSAAGVDESKKVSDWSDSDISKIREAVGTYTIEGELRSENQLNIKLSTYCLILIIYRLARVLRFLHLSFC